MAVDLLGNGTACLVWSSPLPGDARRPMRYIDLMGGQQAAPAASRRRTTWARRRACDYAPSTKFYLQDKLAGKPWITRLPFPVHVRRARERVTTSGAARRSPPPTAITTATSTASSASSAASGGSSRSISRTSASSPQATSHSPYITDDQTLYQPPVKTVTWFHTGAFVDRRARPFAVRGRVLPDWFDACSPAIATCGLRGKHAAGAGFRRRSI